MAGEGVLGYRATVSQMKMVQDASRVPDLNLLKKGLSTVRDDCDDFE